MGVDAAVALLLALINNAQAISQVIQTARAQNRDTLTADEWSTILAADDAARAALNSPSTSPSQGAPPAPAGSPGS